MLCSTKSIFMGMVFKDHTFFQYTCTRGRMAGAAFYFYFFNFPLFFFIASNNVHYYIQLTGL